MAANIRQGLISAEDLVELQLDRIRSLDPSLESFSEVFEATAKARARQLDDEARRGEFRGALHGVPVAVKDLFWVAGTAPNAGGVVFRDVIAPENAVVVDRLESAGAIIVGKLRMSEAALAAHHPDLPTPKNPWDPDAWIGASSSGNAAATAAGLCFGSIGTDTGGSIRFPSAAAGLTGLKPTFGNVSTVNSVEFAQSLDHVGPIARSAHDCSLLFDVIRDPDVQFADNGLPMTFGIDPRFIGECDAATTKVIENAMEVLQALGVSFVEVHLPSVEPMVDDWTPTCAVEAAVFHESTFRERPEQYGPQVRDLLLQGLNLGAVEYERMIRRRASFRREFANAMSEVDGLLLQVTGVSGPDAKYMEEIGVGEEWRRKIMLATCPINFVGLPSLTLPGGQTEAGRPIGFQLVGTHNSELRLLELGRRFQTMTQYHEAHPSGF